MDLSLLKPTLLENIFSEEDYKTIYSVINNLMSDESNKYKDFVVSPNGMKRFFYDEKDSVISNLVTRISKDFDVEIENAGGFFARYNNDLSGFPNLPPHYDSSGNRYACITFTAQMDSNIDWPIYIYDESIQLKKNEAIVFSGNTNIHWRPKIDFKKDSFLDIFVCHFFLKQDALNKLKDTHDEDMIQQRNEYFAKYRDEFSAIAEKSIDPYTSFKPLIIKNIFNDNQIKRIYEARFDHAINKKMQDGSSYTFSDPSCGYITSVYPLPDDVRKRLVSLVQNYSFFIAKEDGIHFPRYTLESGSTPQLKPHYDVGLKTGALTLSVQLKHTKPWKIYVNDDGFDLEFNEAVLFSGTHQIHWRPDIEFAEDDYYDILVCQYTPIESPLPLSDEHRAQMRKKADNYVGKYFS